MSAPNPQCNFQLNPVLNNSVTVIQDFNSVKIQHHTFPSCNRPTLNDKEIRITANEVRSNMDEVCTVPVLAYNKTIGSVQGTLLSIGGNPVQF